MSIDIRNFPEKVQIIYDALVSRYGEPKNLTSSLIFEPIIGSHMLNTVQFCENAIWIPSYINLGFRRNIEWTNMIIGGEWIYFADDGWNRNVPTLETLDIDNLLMFINYIFERLKNNSANNL